MMKKFLLLWIFTLISVWASDVAVDKDTNLMWEDTASVKTEMKNFGDARNYCKNLILEKHSDWRLPFVDELMSIIDKRYYKPAAKPLFVHMANSWYWSQNLFKNEASKVWIVNFFNGSDDYRSKSEYQYVRCVRKVK